ncbi:MAG: hypothetical protein R2911_28400 [Caldilineaceae bacterium]
MTYYKELSLYSYWNTQNEPYTQNVGWLESSEHFAQGTVPTEFSARLLNFCKGKVNLTRGIHFCNLCHDPDIAFQQASEKHFGSAEIRVFYNNKIYAAPDLIFHYVVDHQYLPPIEFIEAVLRGPLPRTAESDRLIVRIEVDYIYR